jgi:hypothetical protein
MESSRNRRDIEKIVRRETEAARAEARAIGGEGTDPEGEQDPADLPLVEAGEGEAEGFDLAEHDLIENASHGDGHADPLEDAITPEVESDRAGTRYGEPDEVDPTEVVIDPDVGPDDPGAGPGIAADR